LLCTGHATGFKYLAVGAVHVQCLTLTARVGGVCVSAGSPVGTGSLMTPSVVAMSLGLSVHLLPAIVCRLSHLLAAAAV